MDAIGVGGGRWCRIVVVVCLIVGDESGEVPASIDVEYGDGSCVVVVAVCDLGMRYEWCYVM